MANEKKTENIVRKYLTKKGYYSNDKIIVEEQQSDFPVIDKLLKNASKKGDNKGYPEFIIRSKEVSEFLIVIECKADIKKHESKNLDKYSEYAVDGVLLYSSFLSKEFDVLAIAVSGETIHELKISQFLFLKGGRKHYSYFGKEILSFNEYYDGFINSDIKYNQDYSKLLEYSLVLNDLLENNQIKAAQRSLLISGILIALQNKAFKSAYKSHKSASQLAKSLVQTIIGELTYENILKEKIDSLTHAFNFIASNTTLNNNKDFFETLISGIDDKINRFMRTHNYFDTIGQFYIEFLRYANSDKELGIVLTPHHITELFVKLGEVNKDSIVFDNCCGTGGFLISAMDSMVDAAKSNSGKVKNIKNQQLFGIEFDDDIFALCVSNMTLHDDGKTNIFPGDCFKLSESIKEKYSPNVGLLNPPYSQKKNELDFVINNLNALEKDSKCISIVPISCVIATSGTSYEKKKHIIENHTVEAIMSMPEDLFHTSKASPVTVTLVITAHKPHPIGKKTWLGYWRNDGFVKVKSKGRIDLNNTWKDIRSMWLNSYFNREVIKDFSLAKELTSDDEWCIEPYMTTDYSKIDKELYMGYVKKYLAYRLLHNLLDLKTKNARLLIKTNNTLKPLSELFYTYNGLSKSKIVVTDEKENDTDIRFIRPSQTLEGSVDGYVDIETVDEKYVYPPDTIYVSTDGQGSHSYSYLSSFDFVPNSNVVVLVPKKEMSIQEKLFYSICITINRYRYSYGRKPKGDRLKKLFLPSQVPEFVYENIFEEILENWKKIIR